MIKITNVTIKRFRSIIEMTLPISLENNMISICGQNNVGKTNTLRAINLFFHPELYERQIDMPKIKNATGGQAIYPRIELDFYDDKNDKYYEVTRDIREYSEADEGLKGNSYSLKGKRKVNKSILSIDEITKILNSIEFIYIESINVMIPELIKNITEDMIDVQYDRARFTQSKKALKESYENYVDGINEILSGFADEISNTFKSFQEEWSVKFLIPKNSDTVRDLISNDISLTLDDKGSQGVTEKGAGLQRLATILLTFEMISRMRNNKNIIVCIDEPDIYLHEGLQRKLKTFFEEKSNKLQLFYTTHSKIFIDLYNMKNVFLLDSKYYEQYSVRKGKKIVVTETFKIDITNDEGYNKICNHLGIEKFEYELLQHENLLVEGECDKKYIQKLTEYFKITTPNIEVLNGADNALKYLEFYDSYYKNNSMCSKPKIKVIFDNDSKGREMFKKVTAKTYNNISVQCFLINNYMGNANLEVEHNVTNNEIEDLLYPELTCYLINELLKKKKMQLINTSQVCNQIKTKAFSSKGILELCEYEKNSRNPENGADISFVSSGNATNKIKEGLAGLFNLEANKKLQDLLENCNKKYPEVKTFLFELCLFEKF